MSEIKRAVLGTFLRWQDEKAYFSSLQVQGREAFLTPQGFKTMWHSQDTSAHDKACLVTAKNAKGAPLEIQSLIVRSVATRSAGQEVVNTHPAP